LEVGKQSKATANTAEAGWSPSMDISTAMETLIASAKWKRKEVKKVKKTEMIEAEVNWVLFYYASMEKDTYIRRKRQASRIAEFLDQLERVEEFIQSEGLDLVTAIGSQAFTVAEIPESFKEERRK